MSPSAEASTARCPLTRSTMIAAAPGTHQSRFGCVTRASWRQMSIVKGIGASLGAGEGEGDASGEGSAEAGGFVDGVAAALAGAVAGGTGSTGSGDGDEVVAAATGAEGAALGTPVDAAVHDAETAATIARPARRARSPASGRRLRLAGEVVERRDASVRRSMGPGPGREARARRCGDARPPRA